MYDVVVVGGGAAGLSAALVLGRSRRRVAVVDGGSPRNAPASHMHGFLSRDGMPPSEFLAAGRAEVEAYGVELMEDRVVRIDHGFTVFLASGQELRSRHILVATGLADELPDIPGVAELWGKDVLHCPYCHGYEVRDQPLGVLGDPDFALLISQWSDDVVSFQEPGGPATVPGVKVVEGRVRRLVIDSGRLQGVELDDGSVVPRAALFVRSKMRPYAELLVDLGCDADPDGWVGVDAMGRTSVPGVWAAGNVVNPMATVIASAAAGYAAGTALNHDLVDADRLVCRDPLPDGVDRAVQEVGAASHHTQRNRPGNPFPGDHRSLGVRMCQVGSANADCVVVADLR